MRRKFSENEATQVETKRILIRLSLTALAGGLLSFCTAPGRAGDLTFNNTPAGNIVSQMSKQYGVTVVFRSPVNVNTPLSFTVQDADTPAGRLEAVSDLANALGLDFQKVYVVSKADSGAAVPEVKVDSNGYIVFPSMKVPVREAIQTVAAVDGAIAQVSGAVTGDVILPERRMSASAAANLIAKQTGTGWKAYYGMFKRGQGPARLEGSVVDRTNGGQAIMELPLVTFRNAISTPAPLSTIVTTLPDERYTGPGMDVTTVPNNSAFTYPGFGAFGGSPYGDNPYGYNPYGYGSPYGYVNPYASPYGYVAPNGGYAAPGYVVTPGVGVVPAVPGVNAPTGVVAPGVGVTTVPDTGATIFP